ncbi:MAG: Crp/Fnr family transcriptional regulator [Polaribacter sp.]
MPINLKFLVAKGICRNQIISLVTKGDLLGERSLISDEASNLKAIALNDMEVCFIPKEEIMRDLERNPDFTMSVLKDMAQTLKAADNVIVDMAQKTVKQRLCETLINLHNKFGVNEENAIDIHLSREDIANIIGTATESVIRLLSGFKKDKIIAFKGKDISILNINELEKIAQGF